MPRFIHLQLYALVAVFAATAILGRMISLSPPALVVWRTALAALGGAFLIAVIRRKSMMPPPGKLLPLMGIGCIVGAHWMCFFGAIRLSNISVCLAGMATTSFFTAFTEPLLDRRRVRPHEVLLGLLVMAGILLIAGFERGRVGGLLLALGGALLAAVFPVLNSRYVKQDGMDPLVMVVWEMVGACLLCVIVLPLFEGADAFTSLLRLQGLDLLWLLILAWVCTVFAHAYHIHILRYISAYTGNLAINFEPVYGIIAAALIFGEHRQLHPGFFIGAGTIIVANALYPVMSRWRTIRSR